MRIGNGVDTVFDMGEELYSSGYLTFADEILSAETFVVSLSSHEQAAGSSTMRTVHALGRRTQGVHTQEGMDKIILRHLHASQNAAGRSQHEREGPPTLS